MSYAEGTRVPVVQTKGEIERLLTKYGATGFASGWENNRWTIMFKMEGRFIRMTMLMPDPNLSDDRRAREERRLWRALLLVVKAKLESVASGVEQFDEAWLPHVVTPSGKTVAEDVLPKLRAAYETGKLPPLLGSGA